MNKRQQKKLDCQLIQAIRELNDDVARSEGFPLTTDEEVMEALRKVKKSKHSINQTLHDYKRFIVNA